jgi:hypothetical protein
MGTLVGFGLVTRVNCDRSGLEPRATSERFILGAGGEEAKFELAACCSRSELAFVAGRGGPELATGDNRDGSFVKTACSFTVDDVAVLTVEVLVEDFPIREWLVFFVDSSLCSVVLLVDS